MPINRIHQIDLLRGIIIILMIIDHAMTYCLNYSVSDPMTLPGTDSHIFWTRFLSHFCAPLFIFLAGLSAGMQFKSDVPLSEVANKLITRGLVLVVFEFTIVSWSWSFNPSYPMLYAQVIWAIGCAFVFIGLLLHILRILTQQRQLQALLVGLIGCVIVVFHHFLEPINIPPGSSLFYVWSAMYEQNILTLFGDWRVRTTYPLLPILGLMAVGFWAGFIFAAKQFSASLNLQAAIVGLAMVLLYIGLRAFNIYGDPHDFIVFEKLFLSIQSLFNPTKYPLSLQFILLTVGIGLIALYWLSKLPSSFLANSVQLLGKMSMFAYIVHLYVLHAFSWLLIPVLGFSYADMTYGETLIGLPGGFGLSYLATLGLFGAATMTTWWLCKLYMPWKMANKHSFIAKYI